MPSHDEIQRIATAMNALRPDWKPSSLITFLSRHHAARSYRDLAIAAAVVASDPDTKTPQLLNEHGAWWAAAQAAVGSGGSITVPRPETPRCPVDGHERELAYNCRACRSERMGLEVQPDDTLALPPEQAETNARGAAVVRAALHRPAPPTADARTRAGADWKD